MKYLKIIIPAVAIMLFVSCEKLDISVGNIWGDWYEYYDSETFSMDGTVKYSFYQDGANGELFVYNALSGADSTYKIFYMIEGDTITINHIMSDPAIIASYKIVKLSHKEMAWQKVGTKYSEGTWGSDYRHFIR